MYYTAPVNRRSRYIGFAVVGALHVGLIWAAATMVRSHGGSLIPDVLTTEIIQELPPPPEEPPPPPPEVDIELAPMPDMVVLPEIIYDTPSETSIQNITLVETVPETRPLPITPKAEPVAQPRSVVQPSFPERLEKPEYPRRSRQLNEEGITTMRVCVTAKGRVSDASLIESSGWDRLDEASLVWVRELRGFKPKKVDGKAVDGGCMILPLEWKIEK